MSMQEVPSMKKLLEELDEGELVVLVIIASKMRRVSGGEGKFMDYISQ